MNTFTSRITTAGAILSTAFLITLPTAWAVPPGGASPNTPGTSSSVSPTTIEPCESLSYSVSGFPAGETLNIKIDDGAGFDQSTHGTGVVASQVIGSDGSASGSVDIPCSINSGQHWLRFLANEPVSGDGDLGVLGYSHRSDYFTVTSGNSNSDSGTDAGTGGTGAGANNAARDNSGGARRTEAARDNSRSRGNRETGGGGGQRSTITRVIDEPAAGGAQRGGGAARPANGGAARPAGGGAAKKPLEQSKLSAGGSGTTGDKVMESGEDGDVYYDYVPVQQTAQAANGQAPIVGMLIGGAILVVGLSGVGAYLYTNRNRPDSTN
ncbi:hypothetical protein OS128_12350 [Corynebacterium sp. P5848]|uniref:hypothetical protein n=1 Tax=Corynebacterium marambiense TaxID=2765364 RepID=UPI002260FD4A|nr:hypothetical protein [Corynebacterium marambiense]MCX7543696.1 hypothetical protein [Corynebacterium marambiense]